MKSMKSFFVGCSIVLTLASAQRVAAQYEYRTYTMPSGMGGVFNNSISATISANMWNRVFTCTVSKTCGAATNQMGTSKSTGASGSSRTQTQPSKPLDESSLRFRPAGTYIKTRELADQLGNNTAERNQYFKLMNVVLDEFGKKATAAGLQNDLALALSYFFGENLRIYRGEPELSDDQYVNIRNLIAQILMAQDGLRNLSDRQKQEMYEALVAYTGITQFGYEQAKQANNEQMAKGFQKIAAQNLQALTKMSPDRLTGGTNQ